MDTYQIDLGTFSEAFKGEWVEIKAKRGWAALKQIEGAALVVRPEPTAPDGFVAEVDLLKQGLAKLEAAVVRWSLPLPVGRAGFMSEEFDEDLGDWLIAQIDAHYAVTKRTADERKTSAGNSTEP